MVVRLFGLIARSAVHRKPIFESAFLALYVVYKKYFEAGPIDRLREFVPSGSLVIEVGANVGFFRFALPNGWATGAKSYRSNRRIETTIA
jgi:hypothetical protein